MSATPETRRSDATRNDERIVKAAIEQLSRNPSAGLGAIAKAAGVGRTTLHRRFQTRDDLLAELRDLALDELRQSVKEARLADDSAPEALDRLIEALIRHLSQFAFLASTNSTPGYFRDRAVIRQLTALIRRGQTEGTFTNTAPAEWWIDVLPALLIVAFRNPRGTRKADAARLITATLHGGLVAPQ